MIELTENKSFCTKKTPSFTTDSLTFWIAKQLKSGMENLVSVENYGNLVSWELRKLVNQVSILSLQGSNQVKLFHQQVQTHSPVQKFKIIVSLDSFKGKNNLFVVNILKCYDWIHNFVMQSWS